MAENSNVYGFLKVIDVLLGIFSFVSTLVGAVFSIIAGVIGAILFAISTVMIGGLTLGWLLVIAAIIAIVV